MGAQKVDAAAWLIGKSGEGAKPKARPKVERINADVTPEMIDAALEDLNGAGKEFTAETRKAADAIDSFAASIGLSGPTFVMMVKMLCKTNHHGNEMSLETVRIVLEGLFRFREHLR